jgi:FkbM family methyltransferase
MRNIYHFARQESLWRNFWRAKIERYLCRANAGFYNERGHKMAVYANDFISVKIFTEGVFERLHLETLLEFLNLIVKDSTKSMTVFDIGANVGNHSLFFSRHFKRVFSFEPHPFTYQLLAFNAQFSSNIKTFNFGLGQVNETLDLYEDVVNFGASSAVHLGDRNADKVQIQIKRLDSIDPNLGQVDLLKIDVEGMEHGVLLGALELIKKQTPIIVLEQLEQEFGIEGAETPSIGLLKSLGYEVYWLERERKKIRWWLLGLPNIIDFFKGGKIFYNIVTRRLVPKATYDMLIAVPPRYTAVVDGLSC